MNNEELLRHTCKLYEDKLIELMGEEDFSKFASEIAKRLVMKELLGMKNSPFKFMVLKDFDKITGTEEEYLKFMNEIRGNKMKGDNDDE